MPVTQHGHAFGFDELGVDETELVQYDYLSRGAVSQNVKRTTYGWGAIGARLKLRGEIFTPITRDSGESGPGTISITSASGAVSDTIRTDVRRPLLHTLEFTNSKDGCADFSFTLHRMPSFPLIPFSIVSIKIGDTAFDWYSGVLNYPDYGGIGISERNGREGPFKFSGKGLAQYLDQIEAQDQYSGGPSVDVTDIVRQMVQDWIVPFSPISYDESKIYAAAGVPLLDNIDTSKTPIGKALTILADQAKCRFGVDGDGDFFFVPYEDEPSAVYFVGKDFHSWAPKENMDSVINYWLLTRNGVRDSEKSGWTVGAVAEDGPSQKKYKFRRETKSFPGYWGDATFAMVAANLIERTKDPEACAVAKNWIVPSTGIRFVPIGRCYVVEPHAKNWTIFDDLDDSAIWTGPVAEDSDVLMWSENSIRIDHAGADSDSIDSEETDDFTTAYLFKDLSFYGKVTKIAFYARATRIGNIGVFGFGDSAWNEYAENPIEIYNAGNFERQEVDIEALVAGGVSSLRYFGVQIRNENPLSLYLDRIEIEVNGARWLNLQVTKVRTDPKMKNLEVEFGTQPPSLPSFMRGLMAAQSDLRFGQEIR
jgi:hypothetical protein